MFASVSLIIDIASDEAFAVLSWTSFLYTVNIFQASATNFKTSTDSLRRSFSFVCLEPNPSNLLQLELVFRLQIQGIDLTQLYTDL